MIALGLYFCLYVLRPGLPLVRTLSWLYRGVAPDPLARALLGTIGSGLIVAGFVL
jgi:hypothetical protein